MKTELNELSNEIINPQLIALSGKVDDAAVDEIVNALATIKQPDSKAEIDTKLDDLEQRKAAGEDISEELKKVRKDVEREEIKLCMQKAEIKPLHDKVFGDGQLHDLTKQTVCEEVAANASRELQPTNTTEKMLIDQMSAAHVLSLKWMGVRYEPDKPKSCAVA